MKMLVPEFPPGSLFTANRFWRMTVGTTPVVLKFKPTEFPVTMLSVNV